MNKESKMQTPRDFRTPLGEVAYCEWALKRAHHWIVLDLSQQARDLLRLIAAGTSVVGSYDSAVGGACVEKSVPGSVVEELLAGKLILRPWENEPEIFRATFRGLQVARVARDKEEK